MDTIRAFPNCPSRSKSLSSLTMKSDFARSAHSRIRLSSGSSLMTLSLAVGITRFVSLANLPRESCSISPPTTRTCRATHEWCRKCRGCRRWNQWWRRSPRALLVSRLSDQAVNVCFRVYPERLRPLPTISHEPQPRAVFQILLDGPFQQFGRLPSLGARSIFQLFCQFAGKRQVGCRHGVFGTIVARQPTDSITGRWEKCEPLWSLALHRWATPKLPTTRRSASR